MQVIKNRDHFYKCRGCFATQTPGVNFSGIEINFDGIVFTQSYFLCKRCLVEAVGYLMTMTGEGRETKEVE